MAERGLVRGGAWTQRRLVTSPLIVFLLLVQPQLGHGAEEKYQRYYNYNDYDNNNNSSRWTTTTSPVTSSGAFVFNDCGKQRYTEIRLIFYSQGRF